MTIQSQDEAKKASVSVLGSTHQPENTRRDNDDAIEQNPLLQYSSVCSMNTGEDATSPEAEENSYSSLLSGMLGSTGTYGQGIVARTCTGIWAETSGGI